MIARTGETAIIPDVKQIIVRVDDDLHAQLKERAAAEHRSLNTLTVEALQRYLEELADPRVRLYRRAQRLGIKTIDAPPGTPPFDPEEFRREMAEPMPPGLGAFVDSVFAEDREWDQT